MLAEEILIFYESNHQIRIQFLITQTEMDLMISQNDD